jgi:hypothetical protein
VFFIGRQAVTDKGISWQLGGEAQGGEAELYTLYALYLSRGLMARAQQFRDATRKSLPYNIDYYFDMADGDPARYVQ